LEAIASRARRTPRHRGELEHDLGERTCSHGRGRDFGLSRQRSLGAGRRARPAAVSLTMREPLGPAQPVSNLEHRELDDNRGPTARNGRCPRTCLGTDNLRRLPSARKHAAHALNGRRAQCGSALGAKAERLRCLAGGHAPSATHHGFPQRARTNHPSAPRKASSPASWRRVSGQTTAGARSLPTPYKREVACSSQAPPTRFDP
jgi:hypothetical protein